MDEAQAMKRYKVEICLYVFVLHPRERERGFSGLHIRTKVALVYLCDDDGKIKPVYVSYKSIH